MNNIPLLSIVIPVYNGANYLTRLFAALRHQTAFCFETVFVDDGSTDDSLSILKAHEGKEPFGVTVVHVPNGGVSAARNIGMEHCTGEYLSFLDCDDLISEDYVKVYMEAVKSLLPDVVVFQSERTAKVPSRGSQSTKTAFLTKTGEEMLFHMAENPTRYGVYNFFLKRSFLKEKGLSFAEGYAYYEDYDFIYRLFAFCNTVRFTETRLYYYLLQEGTAVASFKVERLSNISLLYEDIAFLRQHAPAFLPEYAWHVIPRIYWSVMWQAALAFPMGKALRFGKKTNMKRHLKELTNYGSKKVAISSRLYLISPRLFILAAKLLGRRHSKIGKADWTAFEHYFKA